MAEFSRDPKIREALIQRKPQIIKALQEASGSGSEILTPVEREAFREYVDLMVSEKFRMNRKTAEGEALRLVMRSKQARQARSEAETYRRNGYVKMFSTVLNQLIYFAKDEQATQRVPNQSLPIQGTQRAPVSSVS